MCLMDVQSAMVLSCYWVYPGKRTFADSMMAKLKGADNSVDILKKLNNDLRLKNAYMYQRRVAFVSCHANSNKLWKIKNESCQPRSTM